MARMTPVQAAKELDIRPQIVYGWIRSNRIGTYTNPDGKTALVELEDARRLSGGTKHHRPKDESGRPIKRSPGVDRGSILSYHGETKGTKKRRAHRVVVVDEVVKGDDGTAALIYARRSDDGVVGIVYEAERLADSLAKGKCHIESPEALLGALMFHFVHTDRADLAASLDGWATSHELEPVTIGIQEGEVETIVEDHETTDKPTDEDEYNTPE